MDINQAIIEISNRSIFETQAMILFNQSKTVLMMPVGASSTGKKYRIWNDLSSFEKARKIACEWGKHMQSVKIKSKMFDNIPDNPEVLLCNQFLLNFY